MLKFKINILDALKAKGYSTYYLMKNKVFGQGTIQTMRTGGMVSAKVLNQLCELLECQPGDIMEYVPDNKE